MDSKEDWLILVQLIILVTYAWVLIASFLFASLMKTSINVLPSMNQALYKYCTHGK